MLCKTVLSLKSPTGAFIAPLRCANANLSGRGPSICYRRPFCHSNTPLGCLLLRKRESVRRTRLSSILCVRLRPSAGWLQGSPYRRFLLPPAFYFAGSGMLPGSNLGNRSWLRFSRSTPAGVCRNSTCSPGCWCRCAIPGNPSCCCTDENFSKKTEGWTVPALLTEPNIKGSEIFSKN